jgi:hypothetical protein
MKGFSEIIRGINGAPELQRVAGAFLSLCYGVGALGFTAWNMIEGREFDVVGWCAAFSGGAALLVGGSAGATAFKDKGVANAKVIEQTGSKPATPPAPAPEPQAGLDDDLPDYAR